jgi:hypothetical protein
MYYLFVNHNMPPSVYFDAHESDKRLMLAFIRIEAEEAAERARREATG